MLNALRLPPSAVHFANGNAKSAAPTTVAVCTKPARASEPVISTTNSEPAAKVPVTPKPERVCAPERTRKLFFWITAISACPK